MEGRFPCLQRHLRSIKWASKQVFWGCFSAGRRKCLNAEFSPKVYLLGCNDWWYIPPFMTTQHVLHYHNRVHFVHFQTEKSGFCVCVLKSLLMKNIMQHPFAPRGEMFREYAMIRSKFGKGGRVPSWPIVCLRMSGRERVPAELWAVWTSAGIDIASILSTVNSRAFW